MTTAATACDLVEDQRVSWMWPGAFLVVCVGWLIVPDPWGSLVSAVGFAVASALCVGNAMRSIFRPVMGVVIAGGEVAAQ